jgi:hypothetical protein
MRYLIAITALSAAFTMPAAAHHNCAAGDVCPDEIGDVMGMHEAAIDGMTTVDMTQAMEPADAAAPDGSGGADQTGETSGNTMGTGDSGNLSQGSTSAWAP